MAAKPRRTPGGDAPPWGKTFQRLPLLPFKRGGAGGVLPLGELGVIPAASKGKTGLRKMAERALVF